MIQPKNPIIFPKVLLKGFLIVVLANVIVVAFFMLLEQRREVEWGKAPSAYEEQSKIYTCQKLFWKPQLLRCTFGQLVDSFLFRVKLYVLLTYIPIPLAFNPLLFINYPMLYWLYQKERKKLLPQELNELP